MSYSRTKKRRREVAEAIAQQLSESSPEDKEKLLWQWLFIKVSVGILGVTPVFYFLLTQLGTYLAAPEVVRHPYFPKIAFFVLCGIGLLLYGLRERIRYLYGVLEVAFALAVIGHAVQEIASKGLVAWTIAGTAVYVLVRGIDNFVTGFRSPPPHNPAS